MNLSYTEETSAVATYAIFVLLSTFPEFLSGGRKSDGEVVARNLCSIKTTVAATTNLHSEHRGSGLQAQWTQKHERVYVFLPHDISVFLEREC